MKQQKIRIIMILVLSLCLAGCGKTDSAQQNTEAPVSVSNEVATQEQNSDVEKSNADRTGLFTTEKRQKIVLNGHEIEFPCRYGDFKQHFDIGNQFGYEEYPDIVCIEFEYNGEIAGDIYVKCSHNSDIVQDTDWIFSLAVYDFADTGISFEFCDISESSTDDDVIKKLGKPTKQDEYSHLYYYNDFEDTTVLYEYDGIIFYFDTEHKMKQFSLWYNINNLKEE